MLIAEILIRKRYIEKKIGEFKSYLEGLNDVTIESQTKGALYTTALKQLFDLYGKLQNHNALLDKENSDTIIKIGDSDLSVLDAIHILKTIKNKIGVLDSIICSEDYSVRITDLIEKRDSLMEEYIVFKREIEVSDWSKNIE